MNLDKFTTIEPLADALRTIFGFGKFNVGARVYNNADITISNDTTTAITFNTEHFDTNAIHSTVSNTSRLTCNVSGIYVISGGVMWTNNNTGVRQIDIRLNGSTVIKRERRYAVSYGEVRTTITAIYELSAGNYAELTVYQNSGGDLDLKYYSAWTPVFAMARIA